MATGGTWRYGIFLCICVSAERENRRNTDKQSNNKADVVAQQVPSHSV